MPTFVTVFGRKIPIKYIPKKVLDTYIQNAEGVWDTYTRTIYICKTAPKNIQQYYIYHEAGHAILHFTGLDQCLSPDIQEIICQSYATGLEDMMSQRSKFKK
jgi:Zn-dependent peptidase ImmA (M78 family)